MLAIFFKKVDNVLIQSGTVGWEIRTDKFLSISNLGQSIDAGNEVDTAVQELKILD